MIPLNTVIMIGAEMGLRMIGDAHAETGPVESAKTRSPLGVKAHNWDWINLKRSLKIEGGKKNCDEGA